MTSNSDEGGATALAGEAKMDEKVHRNICGRSNKQNSFDAFQKNVVVKKNIYGKQNIFAQELGASGKLIDVFLDNIVVGEKKEKKRRKKHRRKPKQQLEAFLF